MVVKRRMIMIQIIQELCLDRLHNLLKLFNINYKILHTLSENPSDKVHNREKKLPGYSKSVPVALYKHKKHDIGIGKPVGSLMVCLPILQ